jgi:predicted kinase
MPTESRPRRQPADETTQPMLVLLAGPPGAGKTTLALAVGEALRWPVIDKDTLKSAMLAAGIAEDLAGPASYDLLLDVGRDLLLHQRLSVLLDSPATYPVVVERATALAREAGATLRVVLCLADRELRTRRLAARVARPSQWAVDASAIEDGRREWAGHLPPETLAIRTERPLLDQVTEVLAYLRGR